GALMGLLRGDLGELLLDLAAAFLVAILPLGELEMLQLALVMALLERSARSTQLGEPLVVLAQRMLEMGQLLPLLLDRLLASAGLAPEGLDFALAGENSAVDRIGRMETHAEAAELMSFAVDQNDVRPQLHAG